MAIYRDNYLRIQDLFRTIAEPTLEKQMERYLNRTNQSLEKFLNNTNIKHSLMHMYWNDKVCCENVENCNGSKTRPINRDKLDAYYDYGYKINPQCNVHPCLCHIIAKRIIPRNLEMTQLAFLFRTFEILTPEDMASVDAILKTHTKLKLDCTDQRIKANDFEKMWGALSPNLQKLGATEHDIGLVRIKTIEDSKLKSIDMTSPQRRCTELTLITINVVIVSFTSVIVSQILLVQYVTFPKRYPRILEESEKQLTPETTDS